MAVAQEVSIGIKPLLALGHGVCLLDEAGRVLVWRGLVEQYGLPAASVEGRELREVLQSLQVSEEGVDEVMSAVRSASTVDEPRLISPLQVSFPAPTEPVLAVCVTPAAGAGGQALLLFQDISEAARTRQQFEHILDSTQDGIFLIDTEKRVRLFNRACGEITGRDPAEILHNGCQCTDVINCHNELGESYATSLCPARSVFKGESSYQREEMMLTNAAGQERWIETTYSPVRNSRGEVEYIIGVLRDVHERKLLEDKLNQSEKLASFGQVLAGIAHEIKNPLAIILSSLDVMENPQRPEDQRREAGQFIREEVKRLDDRVRSFLAFARPRELRPRPLVLSGLVARRIASMEPLFPDITFALEKGPSDAIIMGDEEQFTQLVTNLVLNASEAMGGKGTITLRTGLAADSATLEVEDDGPGIPPDLQARIFDPFFTTKASGTGLGLSICYQIVLAHRGTISVGHAKHGTGACFTVRLPIATRF